MIAGPRGAVGGCSTPGSRVDPWWNSNSYCSSVSSPGPPRIDEGLLLNDNDDYEFCSLQSNNNRLNSQANQYHHQQRQHQQEQQHQHEQQQQQQQCNRGGSNNGCYNSSNTSSAPGLGYVDSTHPNVTDGSDPYGLISSSLQHSSASLLQQQLEAGSSDNGANLARVDSSQNQQQQQQQQRQLPSLLSTSSPTSSSTPIAASPDSLNCLLGYNSRINHEDSSNEDRATSSTNYNSSLLSTLLSTSRVLSASLKSYGRRDNNGTGNGSGADACGNENSDTSNLLLGSVKLEYSDGSSSDPREEHNKVDYSLGGSPSDLLLKQRGTPTDITAIDMKFETQAGPPTTPSHLTSTGVEPPHSSQGNQGIVVGGSPGEGVGVESMLLSPWGPAGGEFLEVHEVKQATVGLDDSWDSLMLHASINQQPPDLKLPPFTNYTGHLSINGIPGHHYHTIASSAQRPSMQSTSPSPSSNQEYYESSVVSSSTPCPQSSQKQQHHHQQQQQQELPQSSHPGQSAYMEAIDDIAAIIGSAIADTTVPGSGNNGPGNNSSNNGPSSEQVVEVSSRDWIDIGEWIDTACSPKPHETNSSSPYPQIYVTAATTTPSNPPPQQHGSTLQNLLTHGYSPMLQQRLQASCGETPSSTSPYPPVSPPGRVSTSCSPDHQLHSSFAAPQHTRKRSRPSGGGSHNPSKKSTTTTLAYGTESSLIGGKEKPVHRCTICNRGFLNKSNIKVHLRTHTGEKPFTCEVCNKSFRQKAHLIKHQQIHKRIGRD